MSDDPMEKLIADALTNAGIRFDRHAPHALDFDLPDHGIAIEVKRMHSDRIAGQMARTENVIVAQGKEAVEFLATLIRRSA